MSLRDRAITEYHELLAADETLTPATFEKLRSAMCKKGLLYGDRPIRMQTPNKYRYRRQHGTKNS